MGVSETNGGDNANGESHGGMPKYMKEQLLIVVSTTLSLLTAWSWNAVLQQYVTEHYGGSIEVRLLLAVVVTIAALILINAVLRSFEFNSDTLKHARSNSDLRYYVRKDEDLPIPR